MAEKTCNGKAGRCACEGGTLTRFVQPVILHILSRGPQTGYQLIKMMSEYATFEGESPDTTGIYRYLKTLEKRDMIVQTEADNGTTAPYSLTENGLNCLDNWRETLIQYEKSLSELNAQLKED